MKVLGAKERGNGTYIYDVPSFLIERNGLRYKGTWERHIYIGGSRGEFSPPIHQGVIPPTRPQVLHAFSGGGS
jgi:hypothetical protein